MSEYFTDALWLRFGKKQDKPAQPIHNVQHWAWKIIAEFIAGGWVEWVVSCGADICTQMPNDFVDRGMPEDTANRRRTRTVTPKELAPEEALLSERKKELKKLLEKMTSGKNNLTSKMDVLKTKKDPVAKAQAKTTISFLAKIEKFRNEFEHYIHKGDYKKKKDAVFKDKAENAQNILKEMQEHSKRCSVFE